VNLISLGNQKLKTGTGTKLISSGHHRSLMEVLRLLHTLLKRKTSTGKFNRTQHIIVLDLNQVLSKIVEGFPKGVEPP
jgi:hypothetical protein